MAEVVYAKGKVVEKGDASFEKKDNKTIYTLSYIKIDDVVIENLRLAHSLEQQIKVGEMVEVAARSITPSINRLLRVRMNDGRIINGESPTGSITLVLTAIICAAVGGAIGSMFDNHGNPSLFAIVGAILASALPIRELLAINSVQEELETLIPEN